MQQTSMHDRLLGSAVRLKSQQTPEGGQLGVIGLGCGGLALLSLAPMCSQLATTESISRKGAGRSASVLLTMLEAKMQDRNFGTGVGLKPDHATESCQLRVVAGSSTDRSRISNALGN